MKEKTLRQQMNAKTVREKIARFLWRSHADAGEMVGDFNGQWTFWLKEADKVLRIIRRHHEN